jgi:predicted DNA repair protein MutK
VVVSGAIRTDFILSAEIMVIALNEVSDQGFVARALILAVVASASRSSSTASSGSS